METNEYQIDGDHYAGEYQHWDFVCDFNLHYLPATATKYLDRFGKKGAAVDHIKDLRKVLHYLAKADDRFVIVQNYETHTKLLLTNDSYGKYFTDMDYWSRGIIEFILKGRNDEAVRMLNEAISEMEHNLQFRTYINPDL